MVKGRNERGQVYCWLTLILVITSKADVSSCGLVQIIVDAPDSTSSLSGAMNRGRPWLIGHIVISPLIKRSRRNTKKISLIRYLSDHVLTTANNHTQLSSTALLFYFYCHFSVRFPTPLEATRSCIGLMFWFVSYNFSIFDVMASIVKNLALRSTHYILIFSRQICFILRPCGTSNYLVNTN